jgi:REP-associated tyrosine transposase
MSIPMKVEQRVDRELHAEAARPMSHTIPMKGELWTSAASIPKPRPEDTQIVRLPSYDYRSSGAYFITLCTKNRQPVLHIPSIRTALQENWERLPERFPGITLDEFVIMADHLHGILWLDHSTKDAPTLGRVIGAYKSLVTIAWRNYHQSSGTIAADHLWQRDYYEQVIRNEEDLSRTREYIVNNPLKALLMQEQRFEELRRARERNPQR